MTFDLACKLLGVAFLLFIGFGFGVVAGGKGARPVGSVRPPFGPPPPLPYGLNPLPAKPKPPAPPAPPARRHRVCQSCRGDSHG